MSEESNVEKATKIIEKESGPKRKFIMRKRARAYIMVDISAIIGFAIGIIVGYILAVN